MEQLKQLTDNQRKAVKRLIELVSNSLNQNKIENFIFQAPTGSGKTFMMSQFMNLICQEDDMCFVWICTGRAELLEQSYESINKDVGDVLDCQIIRNISDIVSNTIQRNQVIFINWELLNREGNVLNRDNIGRDNINFQELLENTRKRFRKVILIIDESHESSDTENAMKIRDEKIKPDITIEVSATPKRKDGWTESITLKPDEVIEDKLIKKKVIINDGMKKLDNKITKQNLILDIAYKKREELKNKYEKINSSINPLVIVQIPNKDKFGEEKKKDILDFLEEKGKTIENGKVAIWMSEEKVNSEKNEIKNKDNKVEYIIFKEALKAGWDCPRAQILVQFRKTKSIIFNIQTVGRILRMPEIMDEYFEDEELNTAYVYTNDEDFVVKNDEYSIEIIKDIRSERKDIYLPISLTSYYTKKAQKEVLDIEKYRNYFEDEFCKIFDISKDSENFVDNKNKMKSKNINFEESVKYKVISDYSINSEEIIGNSMNPNIKKEYATINLNATELDERYEELLKTELGCFVQVSSVKNISEVIVNIFEKYLNIDLKFDGIDSIKTIIINNKEVFSSIIHKSISNYQDYIELDKKHKGYSDDTYEVNTNWEIPFIYDYSSETNVIENSKLSLYNPLCLKKIGKRGKVNQLEKQFIEYLDSLEDKIKWFWKNEDKGKDNFGIKRDDGRIFYPDFIISFFDGRIGIFDTKAGNEYNENDNKIKSQALQQYISDEMKKNKKLNLVGGIVIKDRNGQFKYYDRNNYKTYEEASEEWKDFNDLFNN